MSDANFTPNFKPTNKLTPFKFFMLQNFPYIAEDFDSITTYELMCKLAEYMNNVITNVNETDENVNNLYNAYNELQNYINSYFNNLDVQEEINNKLDNMAESGKLQEIIGNYLSIKSLLSFDNVNAMKESKNIINGSYAQTFGFNSFNDGGSQKYKIVKETSATNVNNKNKINIGRDDLYAIALNDTIDVKKYGAYGDGEHDDTEIIQFCIDNFPHKTIYFPEGNYLISNSLKIGTANDKQVNLYLDYNARIFTNTNIDALLEIGKLNNGLWNRYSKGNFVFIIGGIWDCLNTTYGIYLQADRKQNRILNINMINVKTYGIFFAEASHTNHSSDTLIANSSISGTTNETDNSTGIVFNASDNEIDNVRIQSVKKGIEINRNGNLFNNCHITGSSFSALQVSNAIGIELNGIGMDNFTNIYIDNFGKNVIINTSKQTYFNNLITFYYSTDTSIVTNTFIIKCPTELYCVNCYFANITNATNYCINLSEANDDFKKNWQLHNSLHFINCSVRTFRQLSKINDPINSLQIRSKTGESQNPRQWSINMNPNAYYPICVLNQGLHEFNIRMGNDQIIKAVIYVGNSNNSTIEVENIKNNAHNGEYNLALVNGFTDPVDNIFYAYLCIYTTSSDCSFNPNISNVSNSWTSSVFTYSQFNSLNPITSPDVLVTKNFNS